MSFYEDWKFISSIPKSAKPCFYDKTFVHVTEWFVTFKRRWKGEKGEKGIVYIENLIEITEKFYLNSDVSFNVNSLNELKKLLESSIIGLTNLVYTYKIDGQTEVSDSYSQLIKKVKNLIEKVETLIEESRSKSNFFSYVPKIIS